MFTEEQMVFIDKLIHERMSAELKKFDDFLDEISETNAKIRAVGQLAHVARPEMMNMEQVVDTLNRTGETITFLSDQISHWLSEIEYESR